MIYSITAIHDSKTGYLAPAIHPTKDAAIRDFVATCRRPDTHIQQFPVDFVLVYLGTFDSDTGLITPVAPDELCRAVNYVKEVNHEE